MTRPEETARREAQSARDRGEQPPPAREVNLPILQQRTYVDFYLVPVAPADDGSKLLTFVTPDGVCHQWPLTAENAEKIGRELLAPSVQIASADELPGQNGHRPGGLER